MKITLIGAGNLGKRFYASLLQQKQFDLVQWVDRSANNGKTAAGVSVINTLDNLKKTDLYLLAISDESITMVSQMLPDNALVVHTAGGVSLAAINQKRAGVFYPVQSFSQNRTIDFSTVPLGIETKNTTDYKLLDQLAKSLGAQAFALNTKQREQLHLAAVLANNFSNHLFAEAAAICEDNNLPFKLLKPLIRETVNKLETLNPKEAQTGPALRNDQKTLDKHLELIKKPQLKEIYKILTSAIQKNNE